MRLEPNEEKRLLSREPPPLLTEREARVALHVPNVLRVPTDPVSPDPKHWFSKGLAYGSGRTVEVTEGNEVTYLIDGWQTFQAMIDAMETATGPDHFIYLLGWFLGDGFPLVFGDAGTTMATLLKNADAKGVSIRAMLWDNPATSQNEKEVENINALTHGRAILDRRHLHAQRTLLTIQEGPPILHPRQIIEDIKNMESPVKDPFPDSPKEVFGSGSHHQKVLVVNGAKGLIAFCGGIDINPDRVDPANVGHNVGSGVTVGSPMHDVHCRIRGPAARELLRTFVERWKDHPENAEFYSGEGGFEGIIEMMALPSPEQQEQIRRFNHKFRVYGPEQLSDPQPNSGGHLVQIGRTYGNGFAGKNGGIWGIREEGEPYFFAPKGETTAKEIILHAIGQATRFIYIEDQYFTPMREVINALKAALPRIQHLTVLIPDDTVTAMGADVPLKSLMLTKWGKKLAGEMRIVSNQARARRLEAIRLLKENVPDAGKVRVFILSPVGAEHTYVHTKMFIIDDEFAIIGSANCNRRSYTHDSEVIAAIADQTPASALGYNLAHRLRIALWAEHLFGIGIKDPFHTRKQQERNSVFAELADGVASGIHWLSLPPGARVAPYDEKAPADTSGTDFVWDYGIDPEGL